MNDSCGVFLYGYTAAQKAGMTTARLSARSIQVYLSLFINNKLRILAFFFIGTNHEKLHIRNNTKTAAVIILARQLIAKISDIVI